MAFLAAALAIACSGQSGGESVERNCAPPATQASASVGGLLALATEAEIQAKTASPSANLRSVSLTNAAPDGTSGLAGFRQIDFFFVDGGGTGIAVRFAHDEPGRLSTLEDVPDSLKRDDLQLGHLGAGPKAVRDRLAQEFPGYRPTGLAIQADSCEIQWLFTVASPDFRNEIQGTIAPDGEVSITRERKLN